MIKIVTSTKGTIIHVNKTLYQNVSSKVGLDEKTNIPTNTITCHVR